MRPLVLLFVIFTLPACSLIQKHAKLKDPDGKVIYAVEIPNGSVFELTEGDMKLKFDTTGRAGLIEQLLVLGATNTSVQLKNKGGDE
jgi:hypothetical protein